MKGILVNAIFILALGVLSAQNVGINSTGSLPDNSAVLDVSSTDGGMLFPRMTTSERDAISSPSNSLFIFNTTTNCLQIYISGQWLNVKCACDPPSAPEATAATSISSTTFDANWNASSGATSYNLWVDDNSDFSSTIAGYGPKTGIVTTSETVSSLTSGTTYYYRVQAVNGCGTSGNSDDISVTTSSCPTWSDDFTTDKGWVKTTSQTLFQHNASTDVIDFDASAPENLSAISKDLQDSDFLGSGNNADNTAWILRFKLTIDNVNPGSSSNNANCYFGLSTANSSVNRGTTQDYIGMNIIIDTGNQKQYRAADRDNSDLTGAADANFSHTMVAETVWVEIIRTSATTYTVELFSDSGYSTSVEQESGSCASTVQDLRYITFRNNNVFGSGNHVIDGTIDDVEFCNGVTSW